MRNQHEVKPMVDLGTAIEQAEQVAGKSIESVQRTSYYVAGIRVRVPEGQITCSAEKHFNVDLLVGPADIDAKSQSAEEFAKRVVSVRLHFNPFTYDAKTGRMSRGSMTVVPSWQGACTACGAIIAANHMMRNRRGGKPCACKRCGAVDAFKTSKLPVKRPDAASPELQALFDLHTISAPKLDRLALPRAWALYREGRVPTAWIPSADDDAAMNLAIRANGKGMEIRPAQHAIASQSTATSGFVLEGTGGMRAGWLTHKELCGETIELCGYKLQAGTLFGRRGNALGI